MNRTDFMKYYSRLEKGSISRRDFMKLTGLGYAAAVVAACAPATGGASAPVAAANLGTRLELTTWPNYHNLENFEAFTKKTGVNINTSIFGSNEEMLAKLQAGGTGWDVFVPTNYTISTYVKLGLIEPLDLSVCPTLTRLLTRRVSSRSPKWRGQQLVCNPKELGQHRLHSAKLKSF